METLQIGFLLFSSVHLFPLCLFIAQQLISFLGLSDIPLRGCTTIYVYLSIPPLKDILVASEFWQL